MKTKLIDFFSRVPSPLRRSSLYMAFFCLLFLAFFGVRMCKKVQTNEQDFVAASCAFFNWKESLGKKHEELEHVLFFMKKHPELKAEYEARIAQDFIAFQEEEKAKEFGIRALGRGNQTYFKDYAFGSLLISEKKFKDALDGALRLKEEMLGDTLLWQRGQKLGCGSCLFAFNLIRIATLCQELGLQDKELDTWKEIKSHLSDASERDQRINAKEVRKVCDHFNVGSISLLDYISSRQAALRV